MTVIVPAIIAKNAKELKEKIKVVQTFSGCRKVHIDIMDGKFVAGKTLSLKTLAQQNLAIPYELHLMINNPEQKIKMLQKLSVKKIIVHHEASSNLFPLLNMLKKVKILSEVALSPETSAHVAMQYKSYVKNILLMSVYPGKYDAKFLPQVFQKIQWLKKSFPWAHISVDGGVSATNAHKLALSGAKQLCVGSQIFFAQDPKKAYKELKKSVRHRVKK